MLDLVIFIFAILFIILIIINVYKADIDIRKKIKTSGKKESVMGDVKRQISEGKKIKNCPHCGRILSEYALKCKKCGEWIDNDVFRKLNDSDVKLIKSKDLVIATPSMVLLMLRDGIKEGLEKIKKNQREKEFIIKEVIFCSYCYSSVVNLVALKKTGKENLIKNEINKGSILLAMSIFEVMSSNSRYDYNEALKQGLDLYIQLDKVSEEVPYDFAEPEASGFLASQRIGEIIYGKGKGIVKNIELFLFHILTFKHLSEPFSKFFIVEEEDFDWKSMID